MQNPEYLPHIEPLLQALRVNRERLNSKSKIAIDAKLLRGLIQAIIARSPFSDEFYLDAYPDIAEAHAAGNIPDLHRHFVESGFFEGRFGAPPEVDEAFYTTYYKDVGQAVAARRHCLGGRALSAPGGGRRPYPEPADQARSGLLDLGVARRYAGGVRRPAGRLCRVASRLMELAEVAEGHDDADE